jgi:hypothetical protein
MSAMIRSLFGKVFAASLPALVIASSARGAERGSEKVRIAVSSKSLEFLDTWAARERGFYRKHGIDAVESRAIYAKLPIDDARPLAEAVKTVLDQQGKPESPLDRVVDATIIEEVLRERR